MLLQYLFVSAQSFCQLRYNSERLGLCRGVTALYFPDWRLGVAVRYVFGRFICLAYCCITYISIGLAFRHVILRPAVVAPLFICKTKRLLGFR